MVGWSNLIASLPHTSQLNIKLGQVSEDQIMEVQLNPGPAWIRNKVLQLAASYSKLHCRILQVNNPGVE